MQAAESSEFDIEKYLEGILIPKWLRADLGPNLATLSLIVNKQTAAVHYQNLDFQVEREQRLGFDLSGKALLKMLVEERRGGICYEICELAYHALVALKFKVRRIRIFNLYNVQWAGTPIQTHNALIVTIGEKDYLVDTGYGYNSLRYPLEISLKHTTECQIFPNERYQFVVNDDGYDLQMWIKEAWTPLFHIARINGEPEWTDYDLMYSDYMRYVKSPLMALQTTKLGGPTPEGRTGFFYDRVNKICVGYFQTKDDKAMNKVQYETLDEFMDAVKLHLKWDVRERFAALLVRSVDFDPSRVSPAK